MTLDINTPKPFRIDVGPIPATFVKNTFSPQLTNSPNKKRRIVHHCCSRLAASELPGADLAVEYLYGKYINRAQAIQIV